VGEQFLAKLISVFVTIAFLAQRNKGENLRQTEMLAKREWGKMWNKTLE
jgi:hypothetical protein